MDGDARGGAALSIRQVIGQPVKFVGVGEKYDAIEPFYPDRMAQRILGMGDVLSLIEKAEKDLDESDAEELERKGVEYTWFPQGMGFVRKTLSEKRCDLIMGTVQADEFTLNTNPYYRTTYALLTKKGSGLEDITSILDPRLKGKRVGIQAGAPAADYVAKAGLMPTAKSYLFIVDTRYENPMQDMANDVRSGEIDVGILWGPHAGWYAKHGGEELHVSPMLEAKQPGLPNLEYRITMGVRANETAWKHEINNVIAKRQGDIDKILFWTTACRSSMRTTSSSPSPAILPRARTDAPRARQSSFPFGFGRRRRRTFSRACEHEMEAGPCR